MKCICSLYLWVLQWHRTKVLGKSSCSLLANMSQWCTWRKPCVFILLCLCSFKSFLFSPKYAAPAESMVFYLAIYNILMFLTKNLWFNPQNSNRPSEPTASAKATLFYCHYSITGIFSAHTFISKLHKMKSSKAIRL